MQIADGLDNDCDGRIDEEICFSDTNGKELTLKADAIFYEQDK